MNSTSPSLESNIAHSSDASALPFLDGKPGLELQAKVQEAAALLKALANPDRLLLLCQMVDAEPSVAALGELTGIAQPSLSQQLGVLRAERLVSTRRDGKHVLYRVDSSAALAVLRTLHGLFCEPESLPSGRRSMPTNRSTRVAA